MRILQNGAKEQKWLMYTGIIQFIDSDYFPKRGMEKSDESRTRRDQLRRKYSKMDKRAKDKLVRSPGENGGG